MFLEKLTDNWIMQKFFKKITILSDGSLSFSYELTTNLNEFITYSFEDEKNFFLNKKKITRRFNSKQSLFYKKKYLNLKK